ncbi:unnamed protein product [Prunus brigantina]
MSSFCSFVQDVVQFPWGIFLPIPPTSYHISVFSLSSKPFFSNFGAIVTFAILGTLISSVVTGILVYLGGLIYLTYRLPFVQCLMFGALISATDPVTVLSIFQVGDCFQGWNCYRLYWFSCNVFGAMMSRLVNVLNDDY